LLDTYILLMPKVEFCIPTVDKVVPAGVDWFYEVKYDGYRLRVERDGPSNHPRRLRLDQLPGSAKSGLSGSVLFTFQGTGSPSAPNE